MVPTDVSLLYADAFREFTGMHGVVASNFAPICTDAFVRRMQGDEFCSMVERAVTQSGDVDLGFRFGATVGGRGLGLLGVATAAAPALSQSLVNLIRWQPLTSTLGKISIVRSGNNVRLCLTPRQSMPSAVVEGILAGWVAFGRFLVDEALPISAVELAHDSPGREREAESILGCPVVFGAHENAVVAPAAIFDARPRYADAGLHASLSGWLDDCVRVICDNQHRMLMRVAEVMLDGLVRGEASTDRVADQLMLTSRTLQRRLAAGGISFSRLRELLRASVAVCRLSTGRDRFMDIAQRLGFDEQATFSRAVRQWTGRSPREVSRLFATDYGQLRFAPAR